MNKTEILSLVGDLSLGRADASSAASYLDEELERFASNSNTLSLTADVVTVAGTAVYNLSGMQHSVLALFHRGKQLQPSVIDEVEIYPTWRTDSDQPRAYFLEAETEGAFRLYPSPNTSGTTDLTLIATIMPDASYSMPDWLGFIFAWKVLAREFARPSDHQDIEFAAACEQFASTLFFLARM
jgi:hypothetical protein